MHTLNNSTSGHITPMSHHLHRGMAIMLGTLLSILIHSGSALAQLPRTISYQGTLKQGQNAMTGTVDLRVNYYLSGSTTAVYDETFSSVPVVNGVFSIELGSVMGSLPAAVDLSRAVEIGVQVNGSAELTPHAKLMAAPYAFTAYSLNGVRGSLVPVNNTIFPIPLDANGKIAASILPPNPISGILAGPGLMGGGVAGMLTMGIADGGITGNMIRAGTITGSMITGLAGTALNQDGSGLLHLSYDPAKFAITNNKLMLRTDVPVVGSEAAFSGRVALGSSPDATDNYFGTADNANYVVNFIGSAGYGSVTIFNGQLYMGGPLDAGGNVISDLAFPNSPTDAATKDYVDQRIGVTAPLGHDLTGTIGTATLDPTNPGIGDRLIQGINASVGETVISGLHVGRVAWADNADFAGSFLGQLAGDVTGQQATTVVGAIQGIAVNPQLPLDNQVLAFEGEMNRWTPRALPPAVTAISAGPGITVTGDDPARPMVEVTPPSTMGTSGKVSLYNSGSGYAEVVGATINNSNVTSNSIIMCTVEVDAHSNTADEYVVYLSGITNGSFRINLHQANGFLGLGVNEGATVHYVIFN